MGSQDSCSLSAENYYYFRTNGDYKHEEFLATTDLPYTVFQVKAEKRAQVALVANPADHFGMYHKTLRSCL